MALVVARCSPGFRSTTASRRSQVQARPCRPVSFVRFGRPIFARPSALNRYGGWDDASAEAMRVSWVCLLLADIAGKKGCLHACDPCMDIRMLPLKLVDVAETLSQSIAH